MINRRLAVLLALLFTFPGLLSVWAADDPEAVKPTNLQTLNTDKDEDDPHLVSPQQMYYASNADGHWQVMVTYRRQTNQPWPEGKPAPELKSKADARSVFRLEGKYPHLLYFATNKDPEKEDFRGDNFDIFFLIKQGPSSDFTTMTPVFNVCEKTDELHPWLTADGRYLFFSRKDKDGWRVYLAPRKGTSGQVEKPKLIDELPAGFHHATLMPDNRTMYLQGPLEKDRWGLFRSTRESNGWGKPEPLSQLNSKDAPTGDQSPSLSRDGSLLYFVSDRPGGKGGLDLWWVRTADLAK